jgi:DNA invertase Pin-like site-specific DNA recombinase
MTWLPSGQTVGSDLQDLIHTLSELHSVGCDLYLHRQALDIRTPSGRAMFQTLGDFAEYVERGIMQSHTAEVAA